MFRSLLFPCEPVCSVRLRVGSPSKSPRQQERLRSGKFPTRRRPAKGCAAASRPSPINIRMLNMTDEQPAQLFASERSGRERRDGGSSRQDGLLVEMAIGRRGVVRCEGYLRLVSAQVSGRCQRLLPLSGTTSGGYLRPVSTSSAQCPSTHLAAAVAKGRLSNPWPCQNT